MPIWRNTSSWCHFWIFFFNSLCSLLSDISLNWIWFGQTMWFRMQRHTKCLMRKTKYQQTNEKNIQQLKLIKSRRGEKQQAKKSEIEEQQREVFVLQFYVWQTADCCWKVRNNFVCICWFVMMTNIISFRVRKRKGERASKRTEKNVWKNLASFMNQQYANMRKIFFSSSIFSHLRDTIYWYCHNFCCFCCFSAFSEAKPHAHTRRGKSNFFSLMFA